MHKDGEDDEDGEDGAWQAGLVLPEVRTQGAGFMTHSGLKPHEPKVKVLNPTRERLLVAQARGDKPSRLELEGSESKPRLVV